MKEFDFNFENMDDEKAVHIKERIVGSLSWHSFGIKKIHVETEDEKGQNYKKIIIEW